MKKIVFSYFIKDHPLPRPSPPRARRCRPARLPRPPTSCSSPPPPEAPSGKALGHGGGGLPRPVFGRRRRRPPRSHLPVVQWLGGGLESAWRQWPVVCAGGGQAGLIWAQWAWMGLILCGDPAYHCMCSMQVIDITLMKHRLTSITSIRVVQQRHRRSTVCL
jgi:hypothetical protein